MTERKFLKPKVAEIFDNMDPDIQAALSVSQVLARDTLEAMRQDMKRLLTFPYALDARQVAAIAMQKVASNAYAKYKLVQKNVPFSQRLIAADAPTPVPAQPETWEQYVARRSQKTEERKQFDSTNVIDEIVNEVNKQRQADRHWTDSLTRPWPGAVGSAYRGG